MRVLTCLLTAVAASWEVQGPASDEQLLELTIAVRQQNLAELLETFHAVSDPEHQRYGQHLSFEAVNALTAPAADDLAVVERILREMQASNVRRTANQDFVVADVKVGQVEAVLGGDYMEMRHADGRRALRNFGAQLSADLASAVDFIMPLNEPLSAGGQLRVRSSEPNAAVNTPGSLRKLYNVGNASGSVAGNKQAFTGFLEQYWTNIDLQEFNTAFNPAGKGEKPARQIGDGKSGGVRLAGAEAELDAQYMMAMGLHVETEFWSFAGRSPDNPQNEPFLKFMYTLANTSEAPYVISTSYGEDEDSMTLEYQNRCNVEFQKAGVRGISLLFASGDSGVGGSFNCSTLCEAHASGQKCLQASWPAASPYVTAVGGTGGVVGGEKGAGLSSGGFSYRWPMPEWQKPAVAAFLADTSAAQPDDSLYKATGRAFPDVSAQAIDYMVIYLGMPTPVLGTSCAAPAFGGILSLVNDRRLAAGKPTLGFVNPLLYKNADALNDVVGGCNPGCGSKGFCAVPGWDPITGLGTPNFEKLVQLDPTQLLV